MNKLKLGFNTNVFSSKKFKPFPFKALKIISKIGYRYGELRCDKPYWWLDDDKPKKVQELKSFLNDIDVKVSCVCASTASGFERPDNDFTPPGQRFGPSFADKDKKQREVRINFTKKVIDYARALNCDNVNSTTGYAPKNDSFQKCWQNVKTCYKEVVNHAAKHKVSVNIEYEPGKYGPGGLFLSNGTDTLKMIKNLGLKNLGITFDIGHSVVCGEDVCKLIRIFSKHKVLRHIHLEDIKKRVHYHRVPGDGDIDFTPIFKTLSQVGYQGVLSIELYSLWNKNPANAAKRSYKYLMNNFGEFFE